MGILGSLLKGIGAVANEAIKSSTGIDIKKDFVDDLKEKTKDIDAEIAEIKSRKEEICAFAGEGAYDAMLNSANRDKAQIINGYITSGELKRKMTSEMNSFIDECEQNAMERAKSQLKDMDENKLRYLVVNKDKLSSAQKKLLADELKERF